MAVSYAFPAECLRTLVPEPLGIDELQRFGFVTVGLGSVLWAAPSILQGQTPDRTAARRPLVDLLKDVPEASRRSPADP